MTMTDPKMPPNVRVKPLVWEDYGHQSYPDTIGSMAEGVGAFYRINRGHNGWLCEGNLAGWFLTLEAAKAAAQADYTARILSALDLSTVTAQQREIERLRGALSLAVRADDLREVYHSLPNDRNRIGDKRSPKGHARDAWLRAFRKAAREARAALTKGSTDGKA